MTMFLPRVKYTDQNGNEVPKNQATYLEVGNVRTRAGGQAVEIKNAQGQWVAPPPRPQPPT